MPKDLTWDDAEDIGILLSEVHPELEPLSVRFTDLHALCNRTVRVQRRSQEVHRGQARAIQMAWHDEFLDRTQA